MTSVAGGRPISLHRSSVFKADFNASVAQSRIVVLVSPTCPVCLAGAAIVRDALEGRDDAQIRVFFIWLAVLEDDTKASAISAAAGLAIGRAHHYWDETGELSAAVATTLDLARFGRQTAWDLYLLYPPGPRWNDDLPPPARWLHQLRIAEIPELSGPRLTSLLDSLLAYRDLDTPETATPPDLATPTRASGSA